MKSSTRKNVIIIGAGLSGTLIAIYLARRGFQVQILERRKDMRLDTVSGGRSINMTLAERGLSALRKAVDIDQILSLTIPLEGRIVHDPYGSLHFIPYGSKKEEVIYAIKRNDLNKALMDIAEKFSNITISFDERCVELDKQTSTVHLLNEVTSTRRKIQADFIIGADGTFSTVRQQIHRGERANYRQDFLDYGYKEVLLPPGQGSSFQMEQHALHVWPRGGCMLMGIPNLDGSFALTFIMAFDGEPSFNSLRTVEAARSFFETNFPDVTPLLGDFAEQFVARDPAMFLTTKASPWHYRGNVVLLGDACHTVTPFYGQGMNASFEDCQILDACLEQHGDDIEAAFRQFEVLRKPNTDALADMSVQNFIELRDKVRSPMLMARKKMDLILHKLFAGSWLPLYTLITHTTIPYAEAMEQYRRQCRRGRWFGMDLAVLTLAAGVYGEQAIRSLKGRLRPATSKPVENNRQSEQDGAGEKRVPTPVAVNPHFKQEPLQAAKVSAAGKRNAT